MEGVMTGIKPRKMFSTAGIGKSDQGIVDDVRRRMNLVDVISGSGASPLGDPLTQFLLTTGQNLISGESAGGTKLQEIVGATKKPLEAAIKQQQLKNLSRRKLAASLIAKTGAGDFRKAFKEYGQYMINPDTKKPYTEEEFRPVYGSRQLYRKPISPAEREEKAAENRKALLAKKKNLFQQQEYNTLEIKRIDEAQQKILANNTLFDQVDTSNPYVGQDDYTEIAPVGMKDSEGKQVTFKAFEPNDKEDFQPNKIYFLFNENLYVRYDAAKNRLVELPKF
jgi:hypothetical protein